MLRADILANHYSSLCIIVFRRAENASGRNVYARILRHAQMKALKGINNSSYFSVTNTMATLIGRLMLRNLLLNCKIKKLSGAD